MSKRATRLDPMGTLPMFDTATTEAGRVIAAGRFRCGLCNTMGVDEAGELCPSCADHVLTAKCRYTRKPTDTTTTDKPKARKPRKTAARKATAGKSTARTTSARKPAAKAARSEGVA